VGRCCGPDYGDWMEDNFFYLIGQGWLNCGVEEQSGRLWWKNEVAVEREGKK